MRQEIHYSSKILKSKVFGTHTTSKINIIKLNCNLSYLKVKNNGSGANHAGLSRN